MYLKRVILVCAFLSNSAFAIDANQVCEQVSQNPNYFPNKNEVDLLKQSCGIFKTKDANVRNCVIAQSKAYPNITGSLSFTINLNKCLRLERIDSVVAACVNAEVNAQASKGNQNVDLAPLITTCGTPKATAAKKPDSTAALAQALGPLTGARPQPTTQAKPGVDERSKATNDSSKPKETPPNAAFNGVAQSGTEAIKPEATKETKGQAKLENDGILAGPPNTTSASNNEAQAAAISDEASYSGGSANSPSENALVLPKYVENPNHALAPGQAGPPMMELANDANRIDPKEMPQATQKVVKAAEDKGDANPPKTVISASAAAAEKIINKVKSDIGSVAKNLSEGTFVESTKAAMELQANIDKFIGVKKQCVESAERASLYCAEGTSTGVQAVKFMMDFGAPILAAISSAQKSCSSLSKITALAAAGLTAAKGVCATTKFMCDGKCANSQTELKVLYAKINSLQTGLAPEAEKLMKACSPQPSCATKIWTVGNQAMVELKKINQSLEQENVPKEAGTTSGLVANCSNHAKDLALMAVSILGTIKANQSAKKCDEQLSTTGAGELTKQQYCEIPAHAQTPLCTCEKNPKAAGCPQTLAGSSDTTSPSNSGSNQAGFNIKTGGGVSSFASGPNAVKPDSAFSTSPNVSPTISGTNTPSGAQAAKSGGASGSTGVSGPGASDAAGNDAVGGVGQKAKAKKWDFGSFGSFGGSGGSDSSDGKKLNGSSGLGEKELDAINRKIASEQVAAEVSSASGKSNWEKVKSMYLVKDPTFLGK